MGGGVTASAPSFMKAQRGWPKQMVSALGLECGAHLNSQHFT